MLLLLGVLIFVFNILFFIIGYWKIGKVFVLFILYGIVVMLIVMFVLYDMDLVIDDLLFVIVFGGMMFGFGVGFVICNGGVFDGIEIILIIINGWMLFLIG